MIPVHPLYTSWCDRCNWNLQSQGQSPPRSAYESLYISMGQRLSRRLCGEAKGATSLKPTRKLSTLVAFALATVVHLITLACVLFGAFLLVVVPLHILGIIGCLGCLAIAWAMRPRIAPLPKGIVPREKAPALHRIVEEVARALETPDVDGIIIDMGFNASFSQVTWRRKKVLRLGLPLWFALDDEQRVALVAHELAHGINGDPNRNLFIGAAIQSLARWRNGLQPGQLLEQGIGSSYHFLGLLILFPLMLCLSLLAHLGVYVLSHLLYRDAQRAEYQADYLAAQVSGTPAMLSLLDKLHYADTFAYVFRNVTHWRSEKNVFDELAMQIEEMPEREIERIRRVEQLESSRLDATHPPTAYRIAVLNAHPIPRPMVAVQPGDAELIDRELQPFKAAMQKRIESMRTWL